MRLLLLALAACGRVHFAPVGDGVLGGNGDGASCVAATETCNGIDDDCDGLVDEGCPCTPFDITLANTKNPQPGLVWTGSGYLIMTTDASGYYVQYVGGDGSLGARTAIASVLGPANTNTFVWTGSELAVAWTAGMSILGPAMLSRFDATGAALGTPVTVSDDTSDDFATAIWTGDHFEMAWNHVASSGFVDAIVLREVAVDGTLRSPANTLPSTVGIGSFAAAPGGYLVGGFAGAVPQTLVLDPSAAVLATHALGAAVSTTYSSVEIAPRAGAMLATWQTSLTAWTLQPLDATGAPAGAPSALPTFSNTNTSQAAIAGTPGGYEVYEAGLGSVSVANNVIGYVELDASGAVTAGPTKIGTFNTGGYATGTLVVAAGREAFAVPLVSPPSLRLIQQCR